MMAEDKFHDAMLKRGSVMNRLKDGDSYAEAPDKPEQSLEQHAKKANESFPAFNKQYVADQKEKMRALKASVTQVLVGSGLDELQSNTVMEDVMTNYPELAPRIMEGLVSGDLRYVSKEDYEAIKDRFPLLKT
tara:strand:+ start:8260 stop:8658 length:399 start_codon:yes stop_codon:yes gene_type:complete